MTVGIEEAVTVGIGEAVTAGKAAIEEAGRSDLLAGTDSGVAAPDLLVTAGAKPVAEASQAVAIETYDFGSSG